jgi:hypothetical protein
MKNIDDFIDIVIEQGFFSRLMSRFKSKPKPKVSGKADPAMFVSQAEKKAKMPISPAKARPKTVDTLKMDKPSKYQTFLQQKVEKQAASRAGKAGPGKVGVSKPGEKDMRKSLVDASKNKPAYPQLKQDARALQKAANVQRAKAPEKTRIYNVRGQEKVGPK